jgi:hypothetical protein
MKYCKTGKLKTKRLKYRGFSLYHQIQNCSGIYLTFYAMHTVGSFTRGKGAEA